MLSYFFFGPDVFFFRFYFILIFVLPRLTKAIRLLVINSALRQQLGRAGRETVLADYDLYSNVHYLFEKLSLHLEKL